MDKQLTKLNEQVAAKFYWGDSVDEVRTWLLVEKRISEADVDQLIAAGLKDKRKEVRKRAVMRLTFAGIGLLAFLGFLYLQYFGDFVLVGLPVFFVWAAGITSAFVVVRSLLEICSGKSDQPM